MLGGNFSLWPWPFAAPLQVSVEEILHARMADAHKDQQQWNVDPTAHGIYAEPQQIPAEQKESKAA